MSRGRDRFANSSISIRSSATLQRQERERQRVGDEARAASRRVDRRLPARACVEDTRSPFGAEVVPSGEELTARRDDVRAGREHRDARRRAPAGSACRAHSPPRARRSHRCRSSRATPTGSSSHRSPASTPSLAGSYTRTPTSSSSGSRITSRSARPPMLPVPHCTTRSRVPPLRSPVPPDPRAKTGLPYTRMDFPMRGVPGRAQQHGSTRTTRSSRRATPPPGTLDDEVAQMQRVKSMLFDAGFDAVGVARARRRARRLADAAHRARGGPGRARPRGPGTLLAHRGARADAHRLRVAGARRRGRPAAALGRRDVVPGVLGAGDGERPRIAELPCGSRRRRADRVDLDRQRSEGVDEPGGLLGPLRPPDAHRVRPTRVTGASPRSSSTWTPRASPSRR